MAALVVLLFMAVWAFGRLVQLTLVWLFGQVLHSRDSLLEAVRSNLIGVNAYGWQEALALCQEKAEWPLAQHCQLLLISAPTKLSAVHRLVADRVVDAQRQAERTQVVITVISNLATAFGYVYVWQDLPTELQNLNCGALLFMLWLLTATAHLASYVTVRFIHQQSTNDDIATLDRVRDLLARS